MTDDEHAAHHKLLFNCAVTIIGLQALVIVLLAYGLVAR